MALRQNAFFQPYQPPQIVNNHHDVVRWSYDNFMMMMDYVKELEERIRTAVAWVTYEDILPVDAWQVWPIDQVLVDTTGAGDYTVTTSARAEGLQGQAEVQFAIVTGGIRYEGGIIVLGNGEVQNITQQIFVPEAETLSYEIRGINVSVTNGSSMAVRVGT